jgi:CheY-like chemotaxis protein
MGNAAFESAESLNGFYVLVVDGDDERRAVLAGILRYCGALVTDAETPKAALAVMELVRPDAILIDVSNAAHGGLAFIRAIRALAPEDGGTIPTVALGESDADAATVVGLGCDVYVVKPLEPWELCHVISRLLGP